MIIEPEVLRKLEEEREVLATSVVGLRYRDDLRLFAERVRVWMAGQPTQVWAHPQNFKWFLPESNGAGLVISYEERLQIKRDVRAIRFGPNPRQEYVMSLSGVAIKPVFVNHRRS